MSTLTCPSANVKKLVDLVKAEKLPFLKNIISMDRVNLDLVKLSLDARVNIFYFWDLVEEGR